MKKENINYIVYHYEYTNDGRRILVFEPNFFDEPSKAQIHCDVLHYLSSQDFYYCKEGDITDLDLIIDNELRCDLPFPSIDLEYLVDYDRHHKV